PANGNYDLRFVLFNVASNGVALDAAATNSATAVSNGLFTVTLDFGNVFDGGNYWLEIGVRTNGGGSFTILAPRQPITPTPYAIMSGSASNVLGTVPAGGLAGTYGNTVGFTNGGNSFSGNGGGLTGLNASQLTSGTVPAGRLPSNVAFVNSNQVFTGNNVFSKPVGIGMTPAYPLDVTAGQAVGRFPTTNNVYGAVVELINKQTNGAHFLGAINFNNAQTTYPGQISYIVYDPADASKDTMQFLVRGVTGFQIWGGVDSP